MPEYLIGLMSGTSMDGIDAVLAGFDDASLLLHTTLESHYPDGLRAELLDATAEPDSCSVDRMGRLDRQIGMSFANAALELIDKSGVAVKQIRAIGSHGQTLRHQPDAATPFTLQIGDPATIAQATGIATVADFRRADVAAGGQGAPLVPPFHAWLFGPARRHRVVLNVGGIANVTILGANNAAVTGFDTGPGNCLMDRWIQMHRDAAFDHDGSWAATGRYIEALLDMLLKDAYFSQSPPKSSGLEYFNLDWLSRHDPGAHDPQDVQATLCELTARSVAIAIEEHAPATQEVFVCGGGAHNPELLRRLSANLSGATVDTTAAAGLQPDWVEATAFAWLAMRTLKGLSGNLPSVTGASRKVVLGAIHSP